MDLLKSAWIPVRADGGFGPFRLLRYEELLCSDQHWTISLPRDDLALAAIQLLACMTQIIFLPPDDPALRASITKPLKLKSSSIRSRLSRNGLISIIPRNRSCKPEMCKPKKQHRFKSC